MVADAAPFLTACNAKRHRIPLKEHHFGVGFVRISGIINFAWNICIPSILAHS
jgi:hypothetical protein